MSGSRIFLSLLYCRVIRIARLEIYLISVLLFLSMFNV